MHNERLNNGGRHGKYAGLKPNRTYVAFQNLQSGVQAIVRTPPEPPLTLSPMATFRDAQRSVYGIWGDAVRVSVDALYGPVSPFPGEIVSLRGKV